MTDLSELAMCMSSHDRKNHPLCWYADGIYLCTQNETIAAEIEKECERRNLDYGSVRARDLPMNSGAPHLHVMVPYDIHKIYINWSSEECDAALQKRMADWAITKYNRYAIGEGRKKIFYDVWIQPAKEVPLCNGMTQEEYKDDVRTHWAAAD